MDSEASERNIANAEGPSKRIKFADKSSSLLLELRANLEPDSRAPAENLASLGRVYMSQMLALRAQLACKSAQVSQLRRRLVIGSPVSRSPMEAGRWNARSAGQLGSLACQQHLWLVGPPFGGPVEG